MNTTAKHILQINAYLNNRDGIATVIANWHKFIDVNSIRFDYLVFNPIFADNFDSELVKYGEKVYMLPNPYKHPLKFWCESYRFFKTHRYHTVHSHVTSLNFFFYPLAKLFGTKNIIQHVHLTKWSEKKLSGLRNYLMLHAVWPLITHKLACSQAAGKVYFGKNFRVVNNGIDVDKFVYDPTVRAAKRKELGLENNFIIGHIGRLSLQKNQRFLVEVFVKIHKQCPAAKLVLVGGGPLRKQIEEMVCSKNLQRDVFFLGGRTDVAELYQAFDCFVFPSLHEGLGIVAVEAQAAGLPCILADTLPQEAFICNYKKLPLGSTEQWAQEILNFTRDFKRTDTSDQIKAAGFSARSVAQQMQEFYLHL